MDLSSLESLLRIWECGLRVAAKDLLLRRHLGRVRHEGRVLLSATEVIDSQADEFVQCRIGRGVRDNQQGLSIRQPGLILSSSTGPSGVLGSQAGRSISSIRCTSNLTIFFCQFYCWPAYFAVYQTKFLKIGWFHDLNEG